MHGQRHAAVRALERVATLPAEDRRGVTPAVEEHDDLFTGSQAGLDCRGKLPTDDDVGPRVGVLVAHVDNAHVSEGAVVDAAFEHRLLVFARRRVVIGLHRRRRRAEQDERAVAASPHDSHVAAVIARRLLLLVRAVVLLVHHDQAEARQRREHRRTASRSRRRRRPAGCDATDRAVHQARARCAGWRRGRPKAPLANAARAGVSAISGHKEQRLPAPARTCSASRR